MVDEPSSRMKPLRRLSISFVLAASLLLLGFLAFASSVMREPEAEAAHPDQADGIVVLTGGGLRIREGVRLLRQGRARRMLISGVGHSTTNRDIMRLSGLTRADIDCCVTIGRQAHNTWGNAGETRVWARERGLRRLIVVTAAYHMPRSLAELSLELPEAEFVPHPVRPRPFREGAWWLDAGAIRILVREYPKYLFAAARLALARFARPWQREPVTAADGSKPART